MKNPRKATIAAAAVIATRFATSCLVGMSNFHRGPVSTSPTGTRQWDNPPLRARRFRSGLHRHSSGGAVRDDAGQHLIVGHFYPNEMFEMGRFDRTVDPTRPPRELADSVGPRDGGKGSRTVRTVPASPKAAKCLGALYSNGMKACLS